jgi:glyoxylase-like metal-dependent hydrolase (beta-lactamase superfamily II)
VLFGVVPRSLWSKRIPPDENNLVPLAFNCYLIETGQVRILVDTGGGYDFDPRSRERMKLPDRVAPITEYLDPATVDIVVNTHLHWDHCSGNMLYGQPAFPGARYITQRGEWGYAHERNVRDTVSYRDSNYDPLIASGQMELIDGPREIASGVELSVAPGHNRDMMIVKATSAGQTFCMLADLVPTSEHLKPAWVSAFDLFPLKAIETKTRLLFEAARKGWWCGFSHDMNVAFATITEDYKLQKKIQ